MLRAGPGHLCVVSVGCLYTTTSLWRASSTTLTETAHWTAQCVGVCRVVSVYVYRSRPAAWSSWTKDGSAHTIILRVSIAARPKTNKHVHVELHARARVFFENFLFKKN